MFQEVMSPRDTLSNLARLHDVARDFVRPWNTRQTPKGLMIPRDTWRHFEGPKETLRNLVVRLGFKGVGVERYHGLQMPPEPR